VTTIFSDGFESGDLSAWDSSGASADITLEVAEAARTHGDYGCRVIATGAGGGGKLTYVLRNIGTRAVLYSRFYFRVASADSWSGEIRIMEYYADNNMILYAEPYGSGFHVRAWIRDDAGTYHYTDYSRVFALNEVVCLEVEWRAATAPGTNDGVLRLWLDGELVDEKTDIDNDTRTVVSFACPRNYNLSGKSLELHYDHCAVATERIYPVGWFNIYDNDGVGPIDYNTVKGVTCDAQTSWMSGVLSYPASWRFGVRAENAHGEEKNVDVVEEVALLESGQGAPARPNRPTGLKATPAADGKVELTFAYNATGEEAECTHFHVYHDAGSGEVDYTTPVGAIDKLEGIVSHYAYLSGALTDGQIYLFAVRAATTADVEDDGIEFVQVTADAQAPGQPASLTGLVVR